MRAWLKWRREVRRLRRDENRAHERFFRAYHAYKDTAVVFGRTPGSWGDNGPVGRAQAEVNERSQELRQIQTELRRSIEAGP